MARGGHEAVSEPWVIDDEDLTALAYAYRPPGGEWNARTSHALPSPRPTATRAQCPC